MLIKIFNVFLEGNEKRNIFGVYIHFLPLI